jgi:hypothetical protein
MGLEVLREPRQAASVVRDTLRLNASCPSSSCQFEILRATVWSMAAPAGEVHINRVLSAALPTWRLLAERLSMSEAALRAELRRALSTLEDAGDLLELSGGYWGPATTRLVELPAGAGHLLVGGAPSSLLPIASGAVQYHGPHRHLGKLVPELAALPVEGLNSWARLLGTPLQEWAREVFDSFERQSYAPTSADAFEFYMPASARPSAPQFRRWNESGGKTTGTVIARRMRLYGAREYRIVDLRGGRIVGACDLHGVDVRRLMYALDLAAENPVRARRLYSGGQTEWLFTSELPRAEQRTFAAFGTLTIPDDRPFERRWSFARNEELALDLLRALGIALDQHTQENRR